METRKRFKEELWSYFGLTILNLVIAALILALGISLGIMQILDMVESSRILVIPAILLSLGLMAVAFGFYWLIKVAEIIDGVDDIKTAFERIEGSANQEAITDLIIKMMAHYRANKPTILQMIVMGRVGGFLFLLAGGIGMIGAVIQIATSGFDLIYVGQLIGGATAFGVGVAGLAAARYFSIYSRIWDARLQEGAKAEDLLQQTLEAN